MYANVDIYQSKTTRVGEIDVLVLFGNRAIVVQGKSKRLTLEARRGNDLRIKDDFGKSVQHAYEQGYACAKLLNDPKFRLVDGSSREVVSVPGRLKEIYIFCVVSDHYPALSFQARQFLKHETTKTIQPPFIMDVFTLDAMTEMLASPLQFLSYVNKRTGYSGKVMASHELIILSYHLKRNLWLEDKYRLVLLDDDISADLDVAMQVRRDGVPGKRTPDGILTRVAETTLGRIIADIEFSADPRIIDLGLMLLTLSEYAQVEISKAIDKIAGLARKDGVSHDCTVVLDEAGTGLTVHCNTDPLSMAGRRLRLHCERRKYAHKANRWFGICVQPSDAALRFGLNLDYGWEPRAEMDALTGGLAMPEATDKLHSAGRAKRKVGRNDPCPCGSGRKYKKCCSN